MASLIPRIIKDKISRELQYSIKYSDIEFCFLERKADADVYLDVYFWFILRGAWRGEHKP